MHRENEPSSTSVERINVLPNKNMSFCSNIEEINTNSKTAEAKYVQHFFLFLFCSR